MFRLGNFCKASLLWHVNIIMVLLRSFHHDLTGGNVLAWGHYMLRREENLWTHIKGSHFAKFCREHFLNVFFLFWISDQLWILIKIFADIKGWSFTTKYLYIPPGNLINIMQLTNHVYSLIFIPISPFSYTKPVHPYYLNYPAPFLNIFAILSSW